MDWVAFLGSTSTVVSFVVFIGIVLWATSRRRESAFAVAANAPFALPDEDGTTEGIVHTPEQRS